jgi:predicted transcriptional regulator YheO
MDFATIQKVALILKQHSGQRVVIDPNSKKSERLKMARAIAGTIASRPRAIEVIACRIGVSKITAWRYMKEINHGQN